MDTNTKIPQVYHGIDIGKTLGTNFEWSIEYLSLSDLKIVEIIKS